MATANDALFDEFLTDRGHDMDAPSWERDHNKKQCPDCSSLHDLTAEECTVCGWAPRQ
jgi:hypothetical protein